MQHKGKIAAAVAFVFLFFYLISVYWSIEPEIFNVQQRAEQAAQEQQQQVVTGFVTTTAVIEVASALLNKPGGYLTNDVMPPSVVMDNMPSWEFGVLEMTRDITLAMRKDFSRSQSQSTEHPELKTAQPQFNINSKAWILPSAEDEYQKGIDALIRYRKDIANPIDSSAQFYARADNLRAYLKEVEKRLGSLSMRLSSSVGQDKVNTDLAGDSAARRASYAPSHQLVKTPWLEIDNVFYEARGASWALLHFFAAIEKDFADVLEKKNALVSVQQIMRELEATQENVWSPMVLNGSGFGFVANHSLVMANYLSRANAAIIELSELLSQG
ncbi:DUF2333 family protein [Pseudoalteromonas piratica]|uniref:DUF2333 domain-containing protein n=1 Tax=Pseudoalteromonas piratica TaxID=1348114 RepID=A0A0A7ECH3_9GAMM|nr:DUF2333 family protein [Pseudoalteromonas piratica]AIY63796.1 hypothetical protein OM33_00415 [Pseudoalteromonas piratica]